jgi:hypothetical protein
VISEHTCPLASVLRLERLPGEQPTMRVIIASPPAVMAAAIQAAAVRIREISLDHGNSSTLMRVP